MRYLLWFISGLAVAATLNAGEISNTDLEQAIFSKVNAVRKEQGLPALIWNDELARMARTHAETMAAGKKLNHDGFSGRFSEAREKISGLRALGENVAMNFPQEDIVSSTVVNWMKSPVHRENILRKNTVSGVGVARAANGDYYFTQIFGH